MIYAHYGASVWLYVFQFEEHNTYDEGEWGLGLSKDKVSPGYGDDQLSFLKIWKVLVVAAQVLAVCEAYKKEKHMDCPTLYVSGGTCAPERIPTSLTWSLQRAPDLCPGVTWQTGLSPVDKTLILARPSSLLLPFSKRTPASTVPSPPAPKPAL